MPSGKSDQGFGAIVALLVVIVVAVLAVLGFVVYQHTQPSTANNSAAATSSTARPAIKTDIPAPDPYAGWKTYILPEDNTISFKYPSDWTVVSDTKDTSSTPYNHFFKITDPRLYHNNDFVFIFRYSPGQANQLTKECSAGPDTSAVKTEDLTIGNKQVRLITRAYAIDSINAIGMALADTTNNCYVSVPSGVIEASEILGSQSAPTYSLDLNTFNALPEATTFNLIFKSIKF